MQYPCPELEKGDFLPGNQHLVAFSKAPDGRDRGDHPIPALKRTNGVAIWRNVKLVLSDCALSLNCDLIWTLHCELSVYDAISYRVQLTYCGCKAYTYCVVHDATTTPRHCLLLPSKLSVLRW
eukprot:2907323-Amphidinium_carterae.1